MPNRSSPSPQVPTVPTAERILDAAERLFGERVYDGVSTRAITDLAGVRLNLLAYHFGTKDKLFRAVIDRRLDVVVQRRAEAMATLRASAGPVTVRAVLTAFIHPFFDLASNGGPGWLNYARLIAITSQSEEKAALLDEYMQRTVTMYIDLLGEILPGAPRPKIRKGFYYAIALMMSSFSGVHRIAGLADGRLSGARLEAACRPLITFAEAGLLALVADGQ